VAVAGRLLRTEGRVEAAQDNQGAAALFQEIGQPVAAVGIEGKQA